MSNSRKIGHLYMLLFLKCDWACENRAYELKYTVATMSFNETQLQYLNTEKQHLDSVNSVVKPNNLIIKNLWPHHIGIKSYESQKFESSLILRTHIIQLFSQAQPQIIRRRPSPYNLHTCRTVYIYIYISNEALQPFSI